MAITSNLRIFLIDDDILCLTLYKQLLNRLGYSEVYSFTSGNDAVEHIHERPELVFADYNMDGMNGIEVLKELRTNDPSVVVYLISGQENSEVARQAIQLGAQDYIVKSSLDPDRMKALMEKVEALISGSRREVSKKSFFGKLKSGLGI